MKRGPRVGRQKAQVLLGINVRTQRENDGILDPRIKGILQKRSSAISSEQLQAGMGKGL